MNTAALKTFASAVRCQLLEAVTAQDQLCAHTKHLMCFYRDFVI